MIWLLGGSSNVTSGDENNTGVGSASIPVNTPYLYQQSGFTAFSADYYWSAAGYSDNSSWAWIVALSEGNTDYDGQTSSYHVRCVRDEW